MIPYPNLSPFFLELGPLKLRWYSLAYILGILGGTWFLRKNFKDQLSFTQDHFLNFITYLIIGMLLGGRLGYVLIYDFSYFFKHPFEILQLWHGGMSYHGGGIGCTLALLLFSKYYKKNIWSLLDLFGIGATIGIGLGRLANFINGELFGRVSQVPWAMIFPQGGPLPRHPSQLYEAFFEGPVLFCILYIVLKNKPRSGLLFSIYLICYAIMRFVIEFFREPDPQLGLLWGWLSTGQLLCILMALAGIGIWFYLRKLTIATKE